MMGWIEFVVGRLNLRFEKSGQMELARDRIVFLVMVGGVLCWLSLLSFKSESHGLLESCF